MILFLELFTFIILLNFEVLRKITFMIFVFYFFVDFRNHYFYLSSKLCKFLESLKNLSLPTVVRSYSLQPWRATPFI